jgi:hypothetical protein
MKKIIIGISIISILGLSSCVKSILDINSPNPNQASFSTPQLTAPVALENAARISQTNYLPLSEWLGVTATNGGFALDVALNSYQLTSTSLNGSWQNLYLNISNWNYIKQQALQQNFPLYVALANIYQAYDFSCLVDLYNDVPYSDALLKENSFEPKYDKGSDVYDSCVALLDEAVSLLKDPATALTVSTGNDNKSIITFKDVLADEGVDAFLSKWIKFANSLKLRLLLNQSEVSSKSAYIKTEVSKIDAGMLLGPGEDVTADPGYLGSAGKVSPYFGLFFSSPGQALDGYKIYHANKFAINFYSSTNDPRISYFYDKDANGDYSGNDFGDQSAVVVSALGQPSLDPTAPSVLMLSSEALFDQAEAIQRGWLGGDAKSVYQSAIEASFAYTGVEEPEDAAADYTSQSNTNTNWDMAQDKIKLIITQKWAAINTTSVLTLYNDYRRTGYPNAPISIFPGHLDHVPYRLIYPQAEYNLNAANVGAEGAIDPQKDKVFWDQ